MGAKMQIKKLKATAQAIGWVGVLRPMVEVTHMPTKHAKANEWPKKWRCFKLKLKNGGHLTKAAAANAPINNRASAWRLPQSSCQKAWGMTRKSVAITQAMSQILAAWLTGENSRSSSKLCGLAKHCSPTQQPNPA